MKQIQRWAPAVIFALGSMLVLTGHGQRHLELSGDLETAIPRRILGLQGQAMRLSPGEIAAAGVDTYLLRAYVEGDSGVGEAPPFSLYVGFYGSQAQGRTIHSPKNCLPGAGWEPLASRRITVATALGDVPINQYLLQNGDEYALVLYWYQGRGRVQANEYLVKFDLLRDSALKGRSDEALVRIVVPVESSEDGAIEMAQAVAAEVVPALDSVLPAI